MQQISHYFVLQKRKKSFLVLLHLVIIWVKKTFYSKFRAKFHHISFTAQLVKCKQVTLISRQH